MTFDHLWFCPLACGLLCSMVAFLVPNGIIFYSCIVSLSPHGLLYFDELAHSHFFSIEFSSYYVSHLFCIYLSIFNFLPQRWARGSHPRPRVCVLCLPSDRGNQGAPKPAHRRGWGRVGFSEARGYPAGPGGGVVKKAPQQRRSKNCGDAGARIYFFWLTFEIWPKTVGVDFDSWELLFRMYATPSLKY